MRTEALVKGLEANAIDDATLIGLLILALNARNVSIQTQGSGHPTRTKLVQSITEGGRLSQDVERMRVVARQTLANVLSCSLGHGDSGLPARIAGDAIGADAHLGNMATEDFLSCLSKAAIERVGSSLNVQPRQRVKDTRAAVITEAAGSTYVHPAALFALSQAEIAHHSEAPRDYSWDYRDNDDGSDETGEEADGAPGADEDRLEPEPDAELDSADSDENAHLADENPPIVPNAHSRSAPPRSGGRVAGAAHPIVKKRARRDAAPALVTGVLPMSAADRIASGVAKHLSEFRPPKASTRDLIEEAFRRGYELGRSVRLPTNSPPRLLPEPTQEARHGPS